MEVQIDTLIEKVKNYGIEEGKKHAEGIIAEAQKKADAIMQEARQEATHIVENAQSEAHVLEKRGKDALIQAHRDLLLVVKSDLEKILRAFFERKTRDVLTTESLKEIITQALSKWDFGNEKNIFLSLSKEDAQRITQSAIEGLLKEKGEKITIQSSDKVLSGFMVSREGDGVLQFDFTERALSQSLTEFLTPTLRELLQ